MKMNFNCSDKMRTKKNTEFHKMLRFAMTHPLNVVTIGESGVGKEYFARLIYKEKGSQGDFIVFDWECDHSRQLEVLDDLIKNHLAGIMDLGNQKRNTYFFRRIDLLTSQTQLEIFELLESEGKRGGISRSQQHQLSLTASLEKKNGNGNRQSDLPLSPFLELFPLRINMPPLRQRREEIGSLMHKILESVNQQLNRKVLGFSFETFYFFVDFNWPNNIDELRSEIERAVTLTKDNDLIRPDVLSEKIFKSQKPLRIDNLVDGSL
jgi:transcriptional regulator with AAA-type ATPase domain